MKLGDYVVSASFPVGDMSDRSNDGNEGNDQHRDKKRRVRKGTRSCWECKRRKIRCIFATESDTTCRGCLDRGTACISQEFVDDAERHSRAMVGSVIGLEESKSC